MGVKDLIVAGATVGAAAVAGALVLHTKKTNNDSAVEEIPAVLQDAKLGPKICELINKELEKISGDSLIKMTRQLQFWFEEGLSEEAMLELTQDLISTATIIHSGFKVPKVRYGKTEIQMPIVTCGGMRVQKTWFPDSTPVSASKESVIKHASQENLMELLRLCFKMGINHFETARMYGTSEQQFSEALYTLMQTGEIKREDFILQTKISATKTRAEFEKMFEDSWANLGERFGHIDLFSFWCASSKCNVENVLSDADDMCMAAALEYQKQGKIKHIGFSTHGTAENILTMINSEKFAYVNIHSHSFGSYHAEGTPDGLGGHGNKAAVKRAQELDMGVFQISPIDKGGRVYQPSKTVARLLGPKMSPIAFANLTSWKTSGFHTITVGFARSSDLEETLAAVRTYATGSYEADLKAAEDRLAAQMQEKLGKEWAEKGLLNIPSCETKETQGVAIGHVLWCYNLVKAFGMYDFAHMRYKNLEGQKWDKKKSFEENSKKIPSGNMGRCYDPDVDFSKALEKHYDSEAAISHMKEVHSWLSSKSEVDRAAMSCEAAYDLRVWVAYPGDDISITGVLLQQFTFGILGCAGGPTKSVALYSAALRDLISK